MASRIHSVVTFSCDRCHKSLSSCNKLDIVTSLKCFYGWERLHVQILHISGLDNQYETRKADLCKECTISLLSEALKRIEAGERATAGVEEVEEQGWD